MNAELQSRCWACLPKEVRDFIKSDTATAWQLAYARLFGEHNLTSDTEPEEMLMVERGKVVDIFAKHVLLKSNIQEFDRGVHYSLKTLFGDKCLPDKESGQSNLCDTCSNELKDSPDCSYFDSCGIKSCSDYKSKEQPRPKFKVGDKVIVIDNIRAIYTDPMTIKGVSLAEDGKYCYNVIEYGIKFHEDNLEPYTEPIAQNPAENSNTGSLSSKSESMEEGEEEEDAKKIVENTISIAKEYFDNVKIDKDNMEEKELNLLNILSDSHIGETFYSLIEGYVKFEGIELHWEEYGMKPLRFAEGNFNPDGTYQTKPNASCCIWPSKELYEKYPLDAYSAWMEWKEARKSKRWRAEKGNKYWYLDSCFRPVQTREDYASSDDWLYNSLDYFRTEDLALQAADGVREYLQNFHEKNSEK